MKIKLTSPFLLLVALLTLLAADRANLSAATITVTTLADSGTGSLRNAISASANGDRIKFSVSGTITLSSGELIIGKSLSLEGPDVPLSVSAGLASRVFNVTNGTVAISGLNISLGFNRGTGSGDPGRGGGVFNSAAL